MISPRRKGKDIDGHKYWRTEWGAVAFTTPITPNLAVVITAVRPMAAGQWDPTPSGFHLTIFARSYALAYRSATHRCSIQGLSYLRCLCRPYRFVHHFLRANRPCGRKTQRPLTGASTPELQTVDKAPFGEPWVLLVANLMLEIAASSRLRSSPPHDADPVLTSSERVFEIAARVTVLRDGSVVTTRAVTDVNQEQLVNYFQPATDAV